MQTDSITAIPVKSGDMQRPIRVLMVVDGRYPATGGAEMQARLLCSSFAAAGHDVHVLVPHIDRALPVSGFIDGIPVTRLSYPRIKGVGALLLNLRFSLWLLRRQKYFDAIHIHMMHNLAGAAGWLKYLLRPQIIVKVSGAAEFHGGILDPELRQSTTHRLLRWGAQRLDAYQCISQRTIKIMQDAGFPPDRLHFVPNAVDLNRFKPPVQRDQSALHAVFVGRHVPVKGLDVLLKAWAHAALPNGSQLTLAGDGPERARLIALATQLGIGDSVKFPGMIQDVPALLSENNLYVQASHQEGLPNAVLEAMASALPTVATRVSGHEDIISEAETGFLVPPNDPVALAAAITEMAADQQSRIAMGTAARVFVEKKYSTTTILNSLLALYKK
jgi:glycosyltransferase involved in cell wall biosynthesis